MKKLLLSILLCGCMGIQAMFAQVNVARNATYVNSDIYYGSLEVPKAIDGNTSTSCATNDALSSSKYFVIDLGLNYTISKISFNFGSLYPYSVSVFNTSDASKPAICQILAKTGITDITSFTFPGGVNSSRYLRVQLSVPGQGISFQLREFEVYAQLGDFAYTYDTKGNRTQQKLIALKSSQNTDFDSPGPSVEYSDQINEKDILIYPNPTQGLLKIGIQGYEPGLTVNYILYDMNGKLLLNKQNYGNMEEIDLSGQPNGTYILRLKVNDDVSDWKIIKE